jgi:phage shock protein C
MKPAKYKGGHVKPAKTLYRSRSNRLVAGVCGGLADYFNLDVTFIRFLFVGPGAIGSNSFIPLSTGGVAIISYLAMWLLVPRAAFSSRPSW